MSSNVNLKQLRPVMLVAGLLGTLPVTGWAASGEKSSSSVLSQLLNQSESAAGFESASSAYRLRFPRDHLSHNRFSIEWWYLTANLKARDTGEHYGIQFTIFRRGLSAKHSAQNAWQMPQLYMGHMALTDTTAKQHRSVQRFSRQGPGLAGTAAKPLSIWLEDWEIKAAQNDQLFPATLSARDAEQQFGYRLQLTPSKRLLLQGDQGYSTKHAGSGIASHYYSYTRLEAKGELWVDQRMVSVEGTAWYDHEWTSGTLDDSQVGWDWFALQLEDGRDLTVIRLRDRARTKDDYWQLSMADADGTPVKLDASGLKLQVTDHWQSDDGVRYPSGWRLQLDSPELNLEIRPRLADQEMRHMVRYWEGAVKVSGSHSGQGYVELTGYDQKAQTD